MLLEILASRTSVQLQLEAAWVLRRLLLVSVDKNLEDNELQLFKVKELVFLCLIIGSN